MNEWFDTSDCKGKLNRPLPKEINKKVIGKFKDELNWMNMTEFCAPTAKTYASKYEEDDKIKEKKKAKATKTGVIKNDLRFDDYKDSLLKNKVIVRSQQK